MNQAHENVWAPTPRKEEGDIMRRSLSLLALTITLFFHVAAIHAQEDAPGRLDRFGDPLPPGVFIPHCNVCAVT